MNGQTDSRMITIEGFCRKWIGKMGSFLVWYVIQVSYKPKRMSKKMPATRVPMITPLLQGCNMPASCKAKINGIGQQTERIPPIPSRVRIRSAFDLPSLRLGMEMKIKIMAVAHIGPLTGC